MDFLDPKKQKQHKIQLIIGYVLVAIALMLTTTILLYQAYGFGVDKNGQIIQNGLVFVSSTPNPAHIYINGQRYKDDTNVRIPLPSGQYTFELQRDGYNNWKRAITVEGGSVEHFDYPFLYPTKLTATTVKSYAVKGRLSTQSPDRRWLIEQNSDSLLRFDVYDLNTIKAPSEEIALPDGVLSATQNGSTAKLELEQWSTDNRHVLLKHSFQRNGQAAHEFIMLDRNDPSQSFNLTTKLGVNPTKIELRDRAYDQYYLFDETAKTLTTATIKQPQPKVYLDHVLAFKSYSDQVMLYATTKDTESGKVSIVMRDGQGSNVIRTVEAGGPYLLNLTKYSGDWYVAAGAANEDKVYVYKNPVDMLKLQHITVPVHILKVTQPSFIEFSDNARFIMVENGSKFALYDAENDKGYAYDTKKPLDAPQAHASWMDGHRLTYVTGGKLYAFDFDGANSRTLMNADADALPAFSRDYDYVYVRATGTNVDAPFMLTRIPLRTPNDL